MTEGRKVGRVSPTFYWVGHYHHPSAPLKRNWYLADYDCKNDTFMLLEDEDEIEWKSDVFDWISHRVPDPYELRALHKVMYCLDGYIQEVDNNNLGDAKEWYRHLRDAFVKYDEIKLEVVNNENPEQRLDDAY